MNIELNKKNNIIQNYQSDIKKKDNNITNNLQKLMI